MFTWIQKSFFRSDRRLPAVRRRLQTACCLALWAFHCGCGGGDAPADAIETPQPDLWQDPLTIAVWKQSDDIEKYGPEVLKRLRADNPELKSRENWKSFYEEFVAPGFHLDMLEQQIRTNE